MSLAIELDQVIRQIEALDGTKPSNENDMAKNATKPTMPIKITV